MHDNFLIFYKQTIKDALEVIDKGAKRIAIITDNDKKVIGTITDGDIRRGLLNGLSLESSIENIYNRNPIICSIHNTQEEIIEKAIKHRIYQLPIIDENKKLVSIHDIANKLNINKRPNKVILMAGGLGTRLRPLTHDIPKPLLKVGNKPILETIIKNFASYGFVNITISLNYKGDMIKEYFGNGTKFGVNIDYVEETMRLGTAGALSLIKDIPNEPFFVMNADLLTDVNFSHLLDFHSHSNAQASMCVREYDYQVPYGVIETTNENITSIVEKPTQKFFVNAGIYVLSSKVFDYIPKNKFYDMPTLFNTLIEENIKVISFPIHEYWMDIGRMSDFEEAQSEYFRIFNE